MTTATGTPLILERGTVRAELGTVAALLRSLTVDGVALVEHTPADQTPPFGNGIVLVPWPNRVRDALWTLDGEPQQLDITEVARGGALHGLLRFTDYAVREQAPDAVTLGALIAPQHGWPFILDTWVRYALEPDGITSPTACATSRRDRRRGRWGRIPSCGVGDVPVEQLTLTAPAASYFAVDERLNPTAEEPVTPAVDLRTPARRRRARPRHRVRHAHPRRRRPALAATARGWTPPTARAPPSGRTSTGATCRCSRPTASRATACSGARSPSSR